MIILSISDNHDSGACLLKNGEIISAVNEERLNRQKLAGGFPYRSIDEVLSASKILPENINFVIFSSTMTPSSCLRLLDNFHNNLRQKASSFSYFLNLYITYQVIAHELKAPEIVEKFLSSKLIEKKLSKINIKASIICIGHHYAHAASAYFTSGNSKETLIITADAKAQPLALVRAKKF